MLMSVGMVLDRIRGKYDVFFSKVKMEIVGLREVMIG